MCGSHADSVYIIYFIHHIRTGPLHMATSGQITVSFFTPVRNTRNQNTSKKLAHCSTQNTINSKHPSQKQSIISTYITIVSTTAKDTSRQIPLKHSVQSIQVGITFLRHSNTCFGAYLCSAGTQHENLLKSIDYEQCDIFNFAG